MYLEDKPNDLDRQGSSNLGDLCGALMRPAAPSTATDHFARVYELGYEDLIPIIPYDGPISPRSSLALRMGRPGAKDPRGKAPGQRAADGLWSSFPWTTHKTTQADLLRWSQSGAGIGLRMGDGLYGIDVDTTDPVLADRARTLIAETIPGAHVERVGRAPKFLILVRVPPNVRVPFKMSNSAAGRTASQSASKVYPLASRPSSPAFIQAPRSLTSGVQRCRRAPNSSKRHPSKSWPFSLA